LFFHHSLCRDHGCREADSPGHRDRTAISHLIREQLDAHARSLSSIRYIRGDQILHDELRPAFQGVLVDPIRSSDVESWTPHLEKLGLVELDHREKERERQSRRQKRGARNNRRNVVTLPDREPLRTNRTIMPKPGVGLEIPEQDGMDEIVVPHFETATPFPLVPVKDLGPPPQMTSPLRKIPRIRQEAPPAAAANGEILPPPPPKPKFPGRRRGRPPLYGDRGRVLDQSSQNPNTPTSASQPPHSATAAPDQETGTPPPSTVPPSATASPAPSRQTSVATAPAVPVKKAAKPIKNKNGWVKTEGVIHPNIIDGKWHCTSTCWLVKRRVSARPSLM